MAQTSSSKKSSSRNRVYGCVESQSGCLVLDENFVKEQVETHLSSNGKQTELMEAFAKMFANPNIVWFGNKEEYLQFAEAYWTTLSVTK